MTLEIITADLLAESRHGFFTRRGGASSGIFSGLNCGYGSSDQHEAVTINRQRVATAMDVPFDRLQAVHQTHSTKVLAVSEGLEDPEAARPEADALVTAVPGIALSVLTADCQPVLFADHSAGVVGAAHAGWKGAFDGVLEATLEAMENLGANRSNTIAVIGPTISQRSYEVGQEFLELFMDDDPENARFFVNGLDDKYQFNLPAFGLHRLRSAGIGQAEWTGHCTYLDPERFYSYRRATHQKSADYGRMISAIRL